MAYVDLDRTFIRVAKDADPNEVRAYWAELYGTLHWSDLLERPRVVLLAEASSGKSTEFREIAAALSERGETAFSLRVEQLCDRELRQALLPRDQAALDAWIAGSGIAWFFVDSVDEARLTQKKFEDALGSLARGVSSHLRRARVLVSCRGSDWRGQADYVALTQMLPMPTAEAATEQPSASEDFLLEPLREKAKQTNKDPFQDNDDETALKDKLLLVVQLVPLTSDQQLTLATASGTKRPEEFVEAIEKQGLDAWAERPGDLLDLASYWNDHGNFASLNVMVAHHIKAKLSELDRFRPDGSELSADQAWLGAERLAAAMTLGRSFTLEAPGQEPDPTLAAGALVPSRVLSDWTEPKINALVRRGAFAPSTYGRSRFHHRSTQEYLTAAWLNRLYTSGSEQAVSDILFAERYGVETVVPSLRPVAAWLALRQDKIRDEIIRREPMVLLQHGDPRSLPLPVRKAMLLRIARSHAQGEIANDSVDNRLLWSFATPDLAGTIREAWSLNPRPDFQVDLVRMIREGAIVACADLARAVAFDSDADVYHRIVAAQALRACGQKSDLDSLAAALLSSTSDFPVRLATELTKVLFPDHMSVNELFNVMRKATPSEKYSTDGFDYALPELWHACPRTSREAFISRLADLCLEPPHVGDWAPISARFEGVAEAFIPIATTLVLDSDDRTPSEPLLSMLGVIANANRHGGQSNEKRALLEAINQKQAVQRALFWMDAQEGRNDPRWPVTFAHQVIDALWSLDAQSICWLERDLAEKSDPWERRFVYSALLQIRFRSGTLQAEQAHLREIARGDAQLLSDLEQYLKPPPANRQESERAENFRRKRVRDQAMTEASWKDFREDLLKRPDSITDMAAVVERGGWSPQLYNLTDWLRRKFACSIEDAPLHWRALEPAFGADVATRYVRGMKLLWRTLTPEAPEHHSDGRTTVKWSSILAYGAVGLEAAEDEGWIAALSDDEASRASLHGLITERHYPKWLDPLVVSRPLPVVDNVLKQLRVEWKSIQQPTYVINHLSSADTVVPDGLKEGIIETFEASDPPNLFVLGCAVDLVIRSDFPPALRSRIVVTAEKRYAACRNTDPTRAMRYLAILLGLEVATAVESLAQWLEWCAQNDPELGWSIFGVMFGANDPLIVVSRFAPDVANLERLVLLSYGAVKPRDDLRHDGTYSPNARDDAQSGRNAVLKFLLDREGEDAYRAVLRIAEHPGMASHRIRFLELARGMAERDAEFVAFSYDDVRRLNDDAVLPVRNADDLYRVVLSVLASISSDFANADASSRSVLESATTEDQVQEWLAEQLRLRANERYHVTREGEVAEGNKPDILISSAQAQVEVAIEAKHGDNDWTIEMLRDALRAQLADDYLRPAQRRRGVLLVTRHTKKYWINPADGSRLPFEKVIELLKSDADGITSNSMGSIKVTAVGIDAAPRARTRARGSGGTNQWRGKPAKPKKAASKKAIPMAHKSQRPKSRGRADSELAKRTLLHLRALSPAIGV